MRGYQVFGSLTAILFAVLLFLSLESDPPIYRAWDGRFSELEPPAADVVGRVLGEYLWEELYIALLGLILVAVALALSVSVLLRG